MTDDYIRRTAITRLAVEEQQHQLLERTVTAWKRGCQVAVEKGWPRCSSKRALQSRAYDTIRDETGLGSQHAILATHQAAEAISACETRAENGRTVSKPEFSAPTVRYDSRTMTLFDDGTVSLATVESRVRCDLVLPDDQDGYQYQYLDADEWEVTESTLTIRDGEWYLHLGFRRSPPATEQAAAENGTVLGVDLGIEHLAVTSTGRFFAGRELEHRRAEVTKRHRRLQETGTRSAHRTLTRMRRRDRRRTKHDLHRVANGIVEEARDHSCTVIAFEDLTGITDRLPGAEMLHRWAFDQLVTYVEYKAESHGIRVCTVDPRNTSRRCSRTDCDHVAAANRPQRDRFHCQACGYEVHADYNAAKNIGLRAVRCGHTSSHRTGASQCALKSGTISPEEGFHPDSDERAETPVHG
ncbi:RNA-guided endonuclease InsQ/TnpB family protein [Haloglomus litoreum]|uniref:RNA-guided endonuclease InsQ/TnpB family protein n=1 Tax=Haloglomus litoreum TaxID=3034026 RepID=UPI0023E8BDA2|nr:transposase [Haloglomus sp. DT116]